MFAAVVLALAAAQEPPAAVPARPAAPAPAKYPPALAKLSAKDGKIMQTVYVTVPKQVQVTETRLVNGVPETVTVPRTVNAVEPQVVALAEEGLKISTAGGKAVAYKDAAELLKDGAVCVTSYTPVDAEFLKVFKEETLVLILPPGKSVTTRVAPVRPK